MSIARVATGESFLLSIRFYQIRPIQIRCLIEFSKVPWFPYSIESIGRIVGIVAIDCASSPEQNRGSAS
jgi:hypothetical protein